MMDKPARNETIEEIAPGASKMDRAWMAEFWEIFTDCVIELDAEYTVTNLRKKPNSTFAMQNIVGRPFYDIALDKYRPLVLKELEMIRMTGELYRRFIFQNKQGRYYRWTLMALYRSGVFSGLRGVAVDVTEQSQKEVTLNWQRAIIEGSPSLICIVDMDERILYMNAGAHIMTGYDLAAGELRLERIFTAEHYKIVHSEGVKKAVTDGQWTELGELACADGSRLPVEHTMFSVRDDNDEAILIAMIIRDITVFMEHESEMEKARKAAEAANIAKSDFLSQMSHEIRTPMNAILGMTEVQMQDQSLSPETVDAFNLIYDSADLLMRIINDILDLSKIEAGKLEIVPVEYSIASLIVDIVQLNRLRYENKPIKMNLNLDEDTPMDFWGDELRIKQILNNLLSNAFKYTDEGEIGLFVTVEILQDNDVTLAVRVVDTGQGMAEEQLDRLFDEYSRFNMKVNYSVTGTGLGMSITKRLVDIMGGELSVKSELGKGSEFTLRLPQKRVGTAVCGAELSGKMRQLHFHGIHKAHKTQFVREYMPYGSVLVVDDVSSNIIVAKGLLSQYGLKIAACSSGAAAIEKIKNGAVYDIIFLDHMMPEMDGIQALKVIRGMGYWHTIIALTANAVTGQAEMFLSNGFDDFLSKPIDTRELDVFLKKYIRGKHPPGAAEAARREKENKEDSQDTAVSDVLMEAAALDIKNSIEKLEAIAPALNNAGDEVLKQYVTIVHGLKSMFANIGEKELSAAALELEQAGKGGNISAITAETPAFIEKIRRLAAKFKPAEAKKREFEEAERKTLFMVDDDTVNLTMGSNILSEHYNVFTMNSGARLLKTLEKRIPDLILLDVEMPDLNGYDTISLLKGNEKTKDIPVIFLTANTDEGDELKGLSLGALDYITKPFSPSLLLKRIELHLLVQSQKRELVCINSNLKQIVEAKTKSVVELQNAVLDTFTELIECRDNVTGGHIWRTQDLLHRLIEAARVKPLYSEEIKTWDTALIVHSAQLHDVGKIAIDDRILKKPGKLTDEEFDIIKTHVSLGEEVIEKIISKTSEQDYLKQAKILVSTHHEKWDGSGYPKGLKGMEIPLQGRMMAIVDVYDALTSDRPYKKAFSHDEAVGIIAGDRGSHFDPDLVDVFLGINSDFKSISMRGAL